MKPPATLLVLALLHQALCGQIPPAVIPAGAQVTNGLLISGKA